VFLGLVVRLESGKHDMSFAATALDLVKRIVFLSVGMACLSTSQCSCVVYAADRNCAGASRLNLELTLHTLSKCMPLLANTGGALIGYAFGVATRYLLKWLQNHGAKPPQVHPDDNLTVLGCISMAVYGSCSCAPSGHFTAADFKASLVRMLDSRNEFKGRALSHVDRSWPSRWQWPTWRSTWQTPRPSLAHPAWWLWS
jgi:hypothetical protein